MRLALVAIASACVWMILSPAGAHEIKAGSLVIVHPMVDEATAGQAVAQGSLEIRNDSNAADHLLSISSEFAETSEISGSVPVTILPQGHAAVSVVFKNIKAKLSDNEVYAGELTFEKVGKVKIDLIVHTQKH